MEKWKDVKGYEGKYKVSNLGRVKSIKRMVKHSDNSKRTNKERILIPIDIGNGYYRVTLYNGSGSKNIFIHRLVAEHFIPNPENKPEINHKDLDPSNNHKNNLEWSTRKENLSHAKENGVARVGEKHGMCKINRKTATKIKQMLSNKGCNMAEISRQLDVSYNTVYDIKRGRTWKHI